MKNRNKTTLFLYGLCLAIWIIKTVIETVEMYFIDHPLQFGMDIVCVILWTICFILAVRKVRTDKEE